MLEWCFMCGTFGAHSHTVAISGQFWVMAHARASVVYVSSPRHGDAEVEGFKAFVFEEPSLPGGPLVFWEIRRVYSRLGLQTSFHDWWNKIQRGRLAAVVADYPDIDLSHEARASATSAHTLQKKGAPLDPNLSLFVQTEWTFSTRLLLIVVAGWSLSLRKPVARSAVASCLTELFHLLLESHVDELASVFDAPPQRPDHEEPWCGDAGDGSCPHILRLLSSFIAREQGGDLVCFLQGLLQQVQQCGVAKRWFKVCIDALAGSIDGAMQSANLPCISGTPAGIMQPRGRKRLLRLDETLVKYVAADLVASKKHRSAARAARATGVVGERTARDMETTTMSNYLWSRQHLHRQ